MISPMIKFLPSILMLITWFLVFEVPASYNLDGKNFNLKRGKRTVGGSVAPPGSFPYQISLRTVVDDLHFCSGSILTPTVILTAAHCMHRSVSDLIIVAGTNKLTHGGSRHHIFRILLHENFDKNQLKNDIALLFLLKPLFYSFTIKPIELKPSRIGHGVHVTLSGWGKTSFNGHNSDELHFLNLTTIAVSECRNRSSHKDAVTKSTLCTLPKKGEGACMSDSGGPLVAYGKQVGIVSWGERCAEGYPDIYTRVSSFIPWIRKKIEIFEEIKRIC